METAISSGSKQLHLKPCIRPVIWLDIKIDGVVDYILKNCGMNSLKQLETIMVWYPKTVSYSLKSLTFLPSSYSKWWIQNYHFSTQNIYQTGFVIMYRYVKHFSCNLFILFESF